MTPQPPRLDRRTYLRAAAATGLGASVAGCLGGGSPGANEHVVLDEPENYDQLSNAELAVPIHGEQLPEITVPDALSGQAVTTTEFAGDRHVMLTFVFARCSMSCPALLSSLVQAQAESIDEGFAEEFAFLPVTFDPEHDTPDRLRSYSTERGADPDAGNWWFLRPESPEQAEVVVTDEFGVFFEFVPEAERQQENMAWMHSNLVVLANAEGYVERAYTGEPPNPADVLDDIETLRNRW